MYKDEGLKGVTIYKKRTIHTDVGKTSLMFSGYHNFPSLTRNYLVSRVKSGYSATYIRINYSYMITIVRSQYEIVPVILLRIPTVRYSPVVPAM